MTRLGILTPTFERGGCEEYLIALARWSRLHGYGPTVCLPEVHDLASVRADLAGSGIGTAPLTAFPIYYFDEDRFLETRRDTIRSLRDQHFDQVVIVLPTIESGGALIDAAAAIDVPAAVVYQLVPYRHPFAPVEQRLYTHARRGRQVWITVSADNRSLLSASLGWSEDAIEVIPNTLLTSVPRPSAEIRSETRSRLRAELGIPATSRIALTAARLHWQKGHDLLLAAAARLQVDDLHFLWIGRGDLEADLRRDIDRLGLGPRVHLAGHRDDVDSCLAAADLFVLPSRFEGCPFAAMEAMAAGLPCVLSDIGPHREIAPDGEATLVEVSDVDALSSAISRILNEPDHAHALGSAASRRAAAFAPGTSFERLFASLSRQEHGSRADRWPLAGPRRRVAIYGAGSAGREVRRKVSQDDDAVAFIDSAASHASPPVDGLQVLPPEAIPALGVDGVVVASLHAHAICQKLEEIGYPATSIERQPVERLDAARIPAA